MLVHWIWLTALQGISLRQKLKLLERFSDPEELYYTDTDNVTLELPGEIAQALSDKNLEYAQQIITKCADLHIHILTYGDSAYPEQLRNIHNPPLVLYYTGALPDFGAQPVIGVVGTRKASVYGKMNALDMSREIATCGGLVISGGAAGIDTEALKGAMDAGASVVAVLGCGVDVVFPASNRLLFQKIKENGCLISEYPPGTAPLPWQFPERNRIISGLSNGVLVIEAPAKSGALITATEAMEQGRDVFVVPGNINVSTCAGSNSLLQEGAGAVFCGWDVLRDYAPLYLAVKQRKFMHKMSDNRELSWVSDTVKLPVADKKSVDNSQFYAYSDQSSVAVGTDSLRQKLLDCLSTEPVPVDDVIARVQEPAAEVLSALTKMALLGMVINHPGRLVSVKQK